MKTDKIFIIIAILAVVFVIANNSDKITDENFSLASLIVPKIDLLVSASGAADLNVPGKVTINYTVRTATNLYTTASAQRYNYIKVRIERDNSLINTIQNVMTLSNFNALPSPRTKSGTIILTNQPAGSHSYRVKVDPGSLITEKNETNNYSQTITFNIPSSGGGGTTPSTPSTTDDDLIIDTGTTFTIKICNVNCNTANSYRSPDFKVYRDNQLVYTHNGSLLNTGASSPNTISSSFSIRLKGTSGAHQWKVVVDPDNEISETNEFNNTYTIAKNYIECPETTCNY